MSQDYNVRENCLEECSAVLAGIDGLHEQTTRLEAAQRRALLDASTEGSRQVATLRTELVTRSREMSTRMQKLWQRPEANFVTYSRQIDLCRNRLKEALGRIAEVERKHEREVREQAARQYRIVSPEASDAEVQAAVDQGASTGQQQVFAQALQNANRRGQAATALAAINDRHNQVQAIEQQLSQLNDLYQEMDQLVGKQQMAVEDIETNAGTTLDSMKRADKDLDAAVTSAARARRLKWICFWITVAIILIICLAVGIAVPCAIFHLCTPNH